MDDLAVDSDEEVDYSKMDQVSGIFSELILFVATEKCIPVSNL